MIRELKQRKETKNKISKEYKYMYFIYRILKIKYLDLYNNPEEQKKGMKETSVGR